MYEGCVQPRPQLVAGTARGRGDHRPHTLARPRGAQEVLRRQGRSQKEDFLLRVRGEYDYTDV